MLKPLTLSLSLAVALCASNVSLAGGHAGGCATCGIASPQGGIVTPAPQGYIPSGQSIIYDGGCGDACGTPCAAPAKKCGLLGGLGGCFSGIKMPKLHCPKFHLESYYVTKKKWRLVKETPCDTGCGEPACDTCLPAYPSHQGGVIASPQGWGGASGQGWGGPSGQYAPAPAPAPLPAGQISAAPAGQIYSEAPPAPPAPPAAAPPAPAAPAAAGQASSLLFLAPSGN